MKLKILLALMLLTVSAFAEVDASAAGTGGSAGTVVATRTMEGIEVQPIMAPEPMPTSDDGYGTCEITREVSGDVVEVSALCDIELPTPCHSVSYGWVPGKDSNDYTFSVQIMQKPGICTENIQKTRVENSVKLRYVEGMEFGYRINYVPVLRTVAETSTGSSSGGAVVDDDCARVKASIMLIIEDLGRRISQAEAQDDSLELTRLKRLLSEQKTKLESLECNRDVIMRELPTASICVSERLNYEEDLKRLQLALYDAEETGDTEAAAAIMQKITYLKGQLEELPTVTRCAEAVSAVATESAAAAEREAKFQGYAEQLKRFNLIELVANPCSKVPHLDDKISELEKELEGTEGGGADAINDKIGVLVDVKDSMIRACEALKQNDNCTEAINLRNRFRQLVAAVEEGTVTEERARLSAKELLAEFNGVYGSCLKVVDDMFVSHPCMAAQVLEVELGRISETGENTEILGGLYERLEGYQRNCADGQKLDEVRMQVQTEIRAAAPGPVSEQASDVAKVVGELELRKHMVLMDDTLSKDDKSAAVSEIESEKLAMIKDALQNMKQAKLASGVDVNLAPDKMEIEGDVVDASGVTLELPTTGNDTIEATVGPDEVTLNASRARVKVRVQLNFQNGMLKINDRKIKLPDELMEAIGGDSGELELDVDGEVPVYQGEVRKQYKLFAFIPVNVNMHVKAKAESGEILEMQEPWWSVLAV
jgi:hypothetical protein